MKKKITVTWNETVINNWHATISVPASLSGAELIAYADNVIKRNEALIDKEIVDQQIISGYEDFVVESYNI